MRQAILSGEYVDGGPAPTVKELVAEHGVSVGTAHRALELLKAWQLLAGGGRGNRYTIVRPPEPAPVMPAEPTPPNEPEAGEPLDLELVHLGCSVRTYRTEADRHRPATRSADRRDTTRAALRTPSPRIAGNSPSAINRYKVIGDTAHLCYGTPVAARIPALNAL
ncbi:MAG: GntR family transcriptional regulator [Labedaea sp.]